MLFLSYPHYPHSEPEWATVLRAEKGVPVYSPSFSLADQLEKGDLGSFLSDRKPNVRAFEYAEAYRFSDSILTPFDEILPTLLVGDRQQPPHLLAFRDSYLLSRADALLVEIPCHLPHATIAHMLDIPVFSINFYPNAVDYWSSLVSKFVIPNPQSAQDILSAVLPHLPAKP